MRAASLPAIREDAVVQLLCPDRFYVTDNCYYEYDRAPRPPPTALDNRLKTPACKPPPKGGGDAMFKDLTPDYLKTLPEPKSH
jgi:hypothetical protein